MWRRALSGIEELKEGTDSKRMGNAAETGQ